MSNAIVSIRSIQIIAFLAITVLVSSYSRKKCTCECLYHNENEYGSVCDMIRKLLTNDDVNGANIEKLVRKTDDLTNQFDDLSNKQIKERKTVRSLKVYTEKEIKAASDGRSRLRDAMKGLEGAQRESDRQRDTLAKRLKKVENLSLETEQSLTSKFYSMENKIRMLELEIAAKSKEDLSRTSEVRKELLERVEEVEMQTLNTKREVLGRLGETESRLREKDRLIQEMQKAIDEIVEWFRKMEIKSNNLKAKMIKMKKLMVKLKRDMQTNFSLSVEHLKAYTDDHFTQLKQIEENLKSNISKSKDSLVKLEYELSKCATIGNLSDLDRALREVAIASRVEHESLRTEMSIGDENVRKQCAGRDDVTEMNRKLTSLSTDVSKIQDHLGEKKKMRCENTLPLATCTKYVQQHLCRFEHTATQCCESCTKSVGLVPKRTSGTK